MTGTVVQLSCKETEGSPPSEYQWYKNGVALLEKTGTGNARAANITYTMNKKSGTLVSVITNSVIASYQDQIYCLIQWHTGVLTQKCTRSLLEINVMLKYVLTNVESGFCLWLMTSHRHRVIQTNWVSCKAAVMKNEQNIENIYTNFTLPVSYLVPGENDLSVCQQSSTGSSTLKSGIATSWTSVGVKH